MKTSTGTNFLHPSLQPMASPCHVPSPCLSKLFSHSKSLYFPVPNPNTNFTKTTSSKFHRFSSSSSSSSAIATTSPYKESDSRSLGDITRPDFPILHQTVNGYDLVYLDNAATSQKPCSVLKVLNESYNLDVPHGIENLRSFVIACVWRRFATVRERQFATTRRKFRAVHRGEEIDDEERRSATRRVVATRRKSRAPQRGELEECTRGDRRAGREICGNKRREPCDVKTRRAGATEAYEIARAKVAAFINAVESREVVFTRNATEAIHLVAYSWGLSNLRSEDEILLTVAEHHSNIVPWQLIAQKTGATLKYVGLTKDAIPDIDQLKKLLSTKTKLVATHHVSNTLEFVASSKGLVL